MKTAKDYFEKYEKLLFAFPMGVPTKTSTEKDVTLPPSNDFMNAIIRSILKDFTDDFLDRMREEPVLDPHIADSILYGVNGEWNALIELFETEYGEKVLMPDGFINFVKRCNEVIEESNDNKEELQKNATLNNAGIKSPFDVEEEGV